MKKTRFAVALALLSVFLSAGGRAQISTFSSGGSDRAYLSEMAVSGDGRILMRGYTMSTDGALSGRTKSGRTAGCDAGGVGAGCVCLAGDRRDELRRDAALRG